MRTLLCVAACTLTALSSPARASTPAPSIASMVKYADHLLVAKVLRTELIAGSFGNQIRECGVTATVAVEDDLTGRAPRMLTVGFHRAPKAGHSYFMSLSNGQGDFPNEVIIPPRPTEEYRALMDCWSKIPQLRVDGNSLSELVEVSTSGRGPGSVATWAHKFSYLRVPAEVPSYKFPATRERRYESELAADRLMPAVFHLGAEYVSWPEYRELFVKAIAAAPGQQRSR